MICHAIKGREIKEGDGMVFGFSALSSSFLPRQLLNAVNYLPSHLCSLPSWRKLSSLGCLLAAVTLYGCSTGSGDRYERVPASGSVTFQGQPVVDGQIRFAPQRGTKAPVVIEAIRDGRYTTENSGGIPVGRYRVEIRAYDPNVPMPKTPEDRPRPQLLPAKWNVRSEVELVVESGQTEITRDFDLTL